MLPNWALEINGGAGGGRWFWPRPFLGSFGEARLLSSPILLPRKKCKIERVETPRRVASASVFSEGGANGGRGPGSRRAFPRQDENVGSFNISSSRGLDGAEGAPSGNLRGIEDLVHSYPPTSRPRPAESCLGLNAPIPFP